MTRPSLWVRRKELAAWERDLEAHPKPENGYAKISSVVRTMLGIKEDVIVEWHRVELDPITISIILQLVKLLIMWYLKRSNDDGN